MNQALPLAVEGVVTSARMPSLVSVCVLGRVSVGVCVWGQCACVGIGGLNVGLCVVVVCVCVCVLAW